MAENAPPSSAKDTASDALRGLPYYERLRRDLRESLAKKRHIDANLAQLEENILRSETLYLEETGAGNIIKGFDNYIKGAATITTTGGAGNAARRKVPVNEIDRIFSRSSAFLRESSTPGSAQTPSSHAPTPTSSFPTRESSQATSNGANKASGSKKKKPVDEEDDDGKLAKRQKISYGRE